MVPVVLEAAAKAVEAEVERWLSDTVVGGNGDGGGGDGAASQPRPPE